MPQLARSRRVKIFATGFAPLVTLVIILVVAAQFGLNVLTFLTTVEPRNASNHVVRTQLFGVTLTERPATETDLAQEDAATRVALTGVLVGSLVIIGGCVLICVAAATGKPAAVLAWADRKLGSARDAAPTLFGR